MHDKYCNQMTIHTQVNDRKAAHIPIGRHKQPLISKLTAERNNARAFIQVEESRVSGQARYIGKRNHKL